MNKDLDVHELKAKLDAGDKFIFLDVREQYEYEEANLGARLIPLGELMGEMENLREHEEEEIVIHCRSGNRSGMAKEVMIQHGFKNVRNVLGGILDWQKNFG